jgi:hypothetical protein
MLFPLRTHVSLAYIEMGLINVLYSFNLDFIDNATDYYGIKTSVNILNGFNNLL